MCETFKSIKLLVVECQKDGLQIPVKISLGKRLLANHSGGGVTRQLFKTSLPYFLEQAPQLG